MILKILELLFIANSKPDAEKMPYLKKIDLDLKILKTLVRLTYDTGIVDQKKYINIESALLEIGRMLGGWIKKISPKDKHCVQKDA